jgi:hypothetical protein
LYRCTPSRRGAVRVVHRLAEIEPAVFLDELEGWNRRDGSGAASFRPPKPDHLAQIKSTRTPAPVVGRWIVVLAAVAGIASVFDRGCTK